MAGLTPPDAGAELLDADVTGEHVFVLRRDGRQQVRIGEREFAVPEPLEWPRIRSVRRGLALLVDARTDPGRNNAWLITSQGEIVREFSVGDGVSEVMVCGAALVFTYFDEGIYSGSAIGREGVAVFDQHGAMQWGYHSLPGSGPVIDDCDCACTDGHDRVWISPYKEFPLIELNLSTRAVRVSELPAQLRGASALATDGTDFWFQRPSDEHDDRAVGEGILRWSPQSGAITGCGSHTGLLRGLFGPRFLSVEPAGWKVIRP